MLENGTLNKCNMQIYKVLPITQKDVYNIDDYTYKGRQAGQRSSRLNAKGQKSQVQGQMSSYAMVRLMVKSYRSKVKGKRSNVKGQMSMVKVKY